MQLKKCSTCKQMLGLSFFSSNKRMEDRKHYSCKPCARKSSKATYNSSLGRQKKEYYLQNKDFILSKRWAHSRKPHVRHAKLLLSAKQRGLDCNIDFETYQTLIYQKCFYCDSDLPKAGGGLDRVNSDLGYIVGNVVPCCKVCNVMKGALTPTEFFEHVKKIVHKLNF